MPKLPRWLSLALLPLVAFFDAASYYAMRSVLFVHLMSEGTISTAEVGMIATVATVAGLVGTLLTGVVAIAVGPWIPLIAGAGMLALGAVALGILPPEAGVLAAGVVGLAHGVVRPALLGAAARAFPDFRSEQLRNAAFMGIWGASNLAAVVAPGLAAANDAPGGARTVFFAGAAGAFFALVIAAGLGATVWRARDPKVEEPPPARTGSRHLFAIAAIFVIAAVPWATYGTVSGVFFELVRTSPGGVSEHTQLMALNPLAVSVIAAVGVAVAIVLHFVKVRLPSLLFIGIGLILISASTVLLLSVDGVEDGLVVPALLLLSVGEVMAGPLLFSRVAGDLPKRFETLAVAGFSLVTHGAGFVVSVLSQGEPSHLVAWGGAIAAGLVGVIFAIAAMPLQRILAPTEEVAPTEF